MEQVSGSRHKHKEHTSTQERARQGETVLFRKGEMKGLACQSHQVLPTVCMFTWQNQTSREPIHFDWHQCLDIKESSQIVTIFKIISLVEHLSSLTTLIFYLTPFFPCLSSWRWCPGCHLHVLSGG